MRVIALVGLLSGDVTHDIVECGAASGQFKVGIRISAPGLNQSVQGAGPLPANKPRSARPSASTIHFSYR